MLIQRKGNFQRLSQNLQLIVSRMLSTSDIDNKYFESNTYLEKLSNNEQDS